MTWVDYIKRHAPGRETQGSLAEAVGIDQTQVGRWLKGQQPSAASVVQAARNLKRAPVEALVAAGYITPDEAGASVTHVQAVELTDDELVEMVRDRLAAARKRVTARDARRGPRVPHSGAS